MVTREHKMGGIRKRKNMEHARKSIIQAALYLFKTLMQRGHPSRIATSWILAITLKNLLLPHLNFTFYQSNAIFTQLIHDQTNAIFEFTAI